MTELFIKTSRVLRDSVVTELKKENDFLKNYFYDLEIKLKGVNVKVKQHVTDPSGNIQIETMGKLIKIENYRCYVLIKNQYDKIKIIHASLNNIEIEDNIINDMFK